MRLLEICAMHAHSTAGPHPQHNNPPACKLVSFKLQHPSHQDKGAPSSSTTPPDDP